MEIYSIGFGKRTAENFFETLGSAGVEQLIDIRLNNTSQLAGFTKKDDLAFFTRRILGGTYVHEPMLAPSPEIFGAYKKNKGSWADYERAFRTLLKQRRIEEVLSRDFFAPRSALLCVEPTPDECHRRLVIEHLADKWGDVAAHHL